MGVGRQRVLYLPNCVDDGAPGDGTRIRALHGIPAEAPVVLLYTRFFEFEQENLHHVFTEVFRRIPGVRFLVVGKGRKGEEALLLQAARAAGFADALVMAGWVAPAALPDYLAAVGDSAAVAITSIRLSTPWYPVAWAPRTLRLSGEKRSFSVSFMAPG